MRESTFTRSVTKLLPAEVYAWKVSDRFTGGVPDSWYSSQKGDMWVEWKYVNSLKRSCTPGISELQRRWLDQRYEEGRNVAVIVGSPQGCMIFTDKEWNHSKKVTTLLSKKETAEWITDNLR